VSFSLYWKASSPRERQMAQSAAVVSAIHSLKTGPVLIDSGTEI
jgi:hypothetical protein